MDRTDRHRARNDLASLLVKTRGTRTRREFADDLGVTEQTVYNWESGRTRPTHRRHIAKLAHVGIPVALLIDGADDLSMIVAAILGCTG